MRVALAMSGGVDSSVAALLLKEQGHEVIGLTMLTCSGGAPPPAGAECVAPLAVTDARAVARQLAIEHHVVDLSDLFRAHVVTPFLDDYRAGRTPNPCVICNAQIKFGALWRAAAELGAEALATGHYARVGRSHDGVWLLRRGVDPSKDQSYFLFRLSQEQLSRTLFPCGGLTKQDARRIARTQALRVHDKAESQEICFVPERDHTAFLRQQMGERLTPGEIHDTSGHRIGTHPGVQLFTVGQRRGLRLGGRGEPLYVLRINAAANRLVVGSEPELYRESCELTDVHWIPGPPGQPVRAEVRPRYRHPGAPAWVRAGPGETAGVDFDTAQRALAPGQAAVFYDGEIVLGGGWIRGEIEGQ